MRNRFLWALSTALVLASTADAASVSFVRTDSTVSSEAAADGAPAGGHVADFFVTTDADILSVGKVKNRCHRWRSL